MLQQLGSIAVKLRARTTYWNQGENQCKGLPDRGCDLPSRVTASPGDLAREGVRGINTDLPLLPPFDLSRPLRRPTHKGSLWARALGGAGLDAGATLLLTREKGGEST